MSNLEPVTQYRTQLYLPASLYHKVKEKIKEEDVSLAEFVRRLLKKELDMEEKIVQKAKEKAWRKFLASSGIGKGPKDLSYHHDKYFQAEGK